MKKMAFLLSVALTLSVACCGTVFADVTEPDANVNGLWTQDDPSISIYENGTISDDFYAVEMDNTSGQSVTADLLTPNEPVKLLMVNGGFVPGAHIVIENDRTLVPLRVISEILGARVDWNGNEKTVTVTDVDTAISLSLAIDSSTAIVGNIATNSGISDRRTIPLDAPAKLISGKTYVPLRFIAEALGAEVGYTEQIKATPNNIVSTYRIGIVTVEKAAEQPAYTADDGLATVKAASAEMYTYLVGYLAAGGRTFSEPYNPDYDSQAIRYEMNLGRYYVYRLTGFEDYAIFFDAYTGAIFSQKAGLPFLYISKDFINIGWMYQ